MTIQIPSLPLSKTTTYALSSNAMDLTPTLGGPTQRIARLGDRWSMSFNCRSTNYPQGVAVTAALIQGLSGKIRSFIPQPGIDVNATPANITFQDAAAAAGTAVAMTGFHAGFTVQAGQFFNVTTNGIAFLYQVTAPQTADASGNVIVGFQPMLKAQPNAGDVINFTDPVIEGFLQGNQQSWSLSLCLSVGLDYAIKEAQ